MADFNGDHLAEWHALVIWHPSTDRRRIRLVRSSAEVCNSSKYIPFYI